MRRNRQSVTFWLLSGGAVTDSLTSAASVCLLAGCLKILQTDFTYILWKVRQEVLRVVFYNAEHLNTEHLK